MISKELEATILRLHQAEQWPLGTIAHHLQVHRSVVVRVIEKAGQTASVRRPRRCKIDPYRPFLEEQLRRYPRLAASVLFRMCRQRGYPGSERQVRHIVAQLRPRPAAEAYLRLRALPGEQGQVDWGHFGQVDIGRARRRLYAFVLVLSYSRRIFLRFYLEAHTTNFLRGHQQAFHHFGGKLPRVLLYDNLKSCVLERRGEAIRFHPQMLAFAAHYRFEPRPVALARGNEKGRVERAIRYIRDSFFAACRWRDLEELNEQALAWCDGETMQRPWPDDRGRSVAEAFAEEEPHLLAIPQDDFPLEEQKRVVAGKTPYIRFDANDYSIPHDRVRRTLEVRATETRVRILAGTEVIATHPRSWSKGEQIEDPGHIEGLVQYKRRGRQHRGYDRLHHAAPGTRELLRRLGEQGENLGSATCRLLGLLNRYGGKALEQAVQKALAKGVCQVATVAYQLEQLRRKRQEPPPLPVELPDDPRIRGLSVQPHPLSHYDGIGEEDPGEEVEHDQG